MYVHLNLQDSFCHAAVITSDQLHPVRLTQLGQNATKQLVWAMAAPQLASHSSSDLQEQLVGCIPDVTDHLRSVLWSPLQPVLEQAGLRPGDRLVFVPDGLMNFLPLHAIPLADGVTLGDRYEVSYTPSLSVLLQCLRRRRPEPSRMLAVYDPTNDPKLSCPRLEAALAHERFPGPENQPVNQIDRDEFLRRAAEAHVCYWMGHAQFCRPVPFWSGLVYQRTGQRPVTVERDGRQQVDDSACVLTMWRFLEAWRVEGQGIAAALRTAQHWLRDLTAGQLLAWCERWEGAEHRRLATRLRNRALVWIEDTEQGENHRPFESPFFWAPFVAVGQTWNEPSV